MTDVLESIRRLFVPIHKEGYPFIAIAAVVALVLGQFWSPLGWIGAIITVWVCYFFRDPPRVTPVRDGLVVSPADGRVSLITTAMPPLPSLSSNTYAPKRSPARGAGFVHSRTPAAEEVDGIRAPPR